MNSYEIREYFIDDPLIPKLFLQSWAKPKTKFHGCVLITHGISEHSLCYDHVAKALADQGWFVYAWDLQGHGQSQGKRGYIETFSDFSRDLKRLISKIKENETLPTHNFHLIGHSMGGLITLQALTAKDQPQVTSATLSNPALGLAIAVPKLKELASHWLNNVWPTFTLNNEIRYELLSRDPKMMEIYSKDPLRHTKVSAPLFLGMKAAMEDMKDNIDQLKTPVFFQIAAKDALVDPQASLDLFKRITGPKTLKIYEESFHEIYNDLNKQESIDDLINYLGQYKG